MIDILSSSPERTQEIGAGLAQVLRSGDVLSLGGELGAGKTCLTQGIARGLGIEEAVTSPTFVIMRCYEARLPLVHVDVYRFERLGELVDLGLEEVFRSDAVTVVEWGDHVEPLLPPTHLRVDLSYGRDGRRLRIEPRGGWTSRLLLLRETLEAVWDTGEN